MGLFRVEQYKRQRRADGAGNAGRTVLKLCTRGAAVQLQDLGRQRSAMLDCVDSGLKRGLLTFGTLDMGHNRKADLVRRLARAAATSSGMRSTPGSPTSVASNTPPVTNSLMTSAPRAYRSRTCSAASTGLLATWRTVLHHDRPAP